jgi:argininosuccinate synthase
MGGAAGLHDWLTVTADGEVRLTTNRGSYRETLPAQELQALKGAIAKEDYAVDSSKPPDSAPPDWLQVLCIVYRDGKPVKVSADKGAIAELIRAIEKRAAA